MAEPYYITTAISYPNGPPHIGHAYEAVAADVIARFHRLSGRDVRFQTGTDEHGLKVAQKAREEGRSPRELADEMSGLFKGMCDGLQIGYDRFIRTVEDDHHRASQALWSAMHRAGDLYLGHYRGWYSVRDEAYYAEDELVRGDDGGWRSPQGTPVEWTEEESWFFRLSRFQEPLLRLYREHPEFIQPDSRRNEVTRFVERGLSDLSVSRTSFDWGVPVPDSPDHVMYVWVDALVNYLTGLGYPDRSDTYRRYWPANLHLVGKDIVRFHAVYWPAFLMSAEIPLPKSIFGHGFLLSRGEKMSKSTGNVVDPAALVDLLGVDAVRWFLIREISFGSDGSFDLEAMARSANADLANSFGNLAQRTLSMVARNMGGALSEVAADGQDQELLREVREAVAEYRGQFAELRLSVGLEAWMRAVFACNAYVDAQAPWALRKTDPDRMRAVLMTLVEALRLLAISIQPVIPGAADRLLDQLSISAGHRDFHALDAAPVRATASLPAPAPIFPRIELEGAG